MKRKTRNQEQYAAHREELLQRFERITEFPFTVLSLILLKKPGVSKRKLPHPGLIPMEPPAGFDY